MHPPLSHRGSRSATERAWRSRLCQLVQGEALVQGSLVRMARPCGNPGCRCARRGQKHVSWYLAVTRHGKSQMFYIPHTWEPRVKESIQQYRQIRQLLRQLSDLAVERLRRRQE